MSGDSAPDDLAAALRACERRFRRFVDHAADGLFLSVRGGAFVDVNVAACSSLGYTREELLGLGVLDVQDGIDERALERLWDTMVPGEQVTLETVSRRKDGSQYPAEVRVGRLDWEGEERMLALVRDVTARKESEAELIRRAERQAAVAELGRRALDRVDTTALMDESARVLRATLRVDYAGVLELQADGQSLLLRVGEGWREGAVGHATVTLADTHAGRTLERGGPVVVADLETEERLRESKLLHEHGVVSGTSSVIQGRAGSFGLLGVHTRSAREFTRDEINFVQAVANVLGAAVSRAREEVLQAHFERSRRVEAVGQLAGGIAHEFNNLLAVILNYTQFALDAAASQPELCADLEEIDKAAQRAAELTRELLTFSRQEPLETAVVDVNDVIRGSEAMLRGTIGERITLRIDLADERCLAAAGPGQLEQVLVQLVVNAREAMPDGGVLALTTGRIAFEEGQAADARVLPGRFVRLTVADTGPGMSEEVAAHAFDLFFSSKAAGEGSGLGLATVHSVVRQLGGFVRLYSEEGVGTALKIYLPAGDPVEAPTAPSDLAADDGHGARILLVEDDEGIRRLTLRILSEHGYDVLAANGIDEALAAWEEGRLDVDLLLTDVVMSGMSGAALAQRLRAERPGLAVLFMSGYTGGVVALDGPQAGAAVVEKPFSSSGLLRGVREALSARV